MWNRKKLRKKAGALVLAAALTTGLVSPFSVFAEGETTEGQATVQEVNAEETVETKAESSEKTEATAEVKTEQRVETEPKAQKEEVSEKEERDYDTTKPVIEKVTFEQNGKTLKPGDTVKVVIEAYDTDSGIDRIDAEIIFDEGYTSMDVENKEESNRYEATYQLPEEINSTSGSIAIRVVDKVGNYVQYDNQELKFSIEFSKEEEEPGEVYVVSDLQFAGQGQTFHDGEFIEFSYILNNHEMIENEEIMSVGFRGDSYIKYTSANYNGMTGRYEGFMYINYTPGEMAGGKWILDSISSEWDGKYANHDISGLGEVWFNVETNEEEEEEQEPQDNEKPRITSIELSHNGEFVKPGDKVIVTIKAEDNVELNRWNASADFVAAEKGIENSYVQVPLEYDEEKESYVGSFEILENTYPCEWYLSHLNICDFAQNSADDYELLYGSGYPYYVNVKNGDTFVDVTNKIVFQFDSLNTRGRWESILETSKEVPRRGDLSFKEAGIDLPIPTKTYKGLTFKGWVDENGKLVDENTKINCINEDQYYLAKYDKTPAYVEYSYIDEKGEMRSDSKIHLWPENLTYNEAYKIANELPLPSDPCEGVQFQKWEIEFHGNEEDDDLISSANFYLKAVYDKAVGNFSYSYLDKNNSWKTVNEVVPIDKEANPVKVLEKANDYLVSDGTEDEAFREWEIEYSFDTERPLEDHVSAAFVAVYEDIKIVTVTKEYRDETGKVTQDSESKIVKDGTTYGEVIEEALEEELPKMFEGLRFKQWDVWYNGMEDEPIVESAWSVGLWAEYENHLTSYWVVESEDDVDELHWMADGGAIDWENMPSEIKAQKYEAVEDGAKITFPTEIGDYVIRKYYGVANSEGGPYYTEIPNEEYEITWDERFMVVGTKKEEPDKPVDPEEPQEKSATLISGTWTGKDDIVIEVEGRGHSSKVLEVYYYEKGASVGGVKMDATVEVDKDGNGTITFKNEDVKNATTFDGEKYVPFDWTKTDKLEVVVGFADDTSEFVFVPIDYKEGSEEPDKPVDPENPDKPTDPEEPQKPSTELPQDVVDKEVDKINKGEDVQIQMGEATTVPEEILEAAKGKDVEIKLKMGDYTWTINGKDIKANELKDINLEVEVDSDAIPDKIVSELAGDNPTCQLSLTHNGPFGFKAELTVNVGAENSGKFGNLYYYDSDGKMIYKNAGKVDANGNVTLNFDHASDYVIVLSEKQMSQDDVPSTSEPTDPNKGDNENGNTNGNENGNTNNNTNNDKNENADEETNNNTNETVKTGDTAPVFVLLVLAIISVCAVVFVLRRKMTR